MYFKDAGQEKQTINQKLATWTGNRQQGSKKHIFTLNCWIRAAEINSKVKLILGSENPQCLPGCAAQRRPSVNVAAEQGRGMGARGRGRTDQSAVNRVHPGAWDWGAPERTTGHHNPINPVTPLQKDAAGAWRTRHDTVPGKSEELRQWQLCDYTK